jgi:general secretion pathway protein D
VLILLAAIQGGCAATDKRAGMRSPDVLDQIRAVDLRPPFYQGAKADETAGSLEGPQPVSFYGDGTPVVAVGQQNKRSTANHGLKRNVAENSLTTGSLPVEAEGDAARQGYEMNFENTPVPTVAKAILGDILRVGYIIDPRVQGTVSLSSGRPVPKKDLLYVLESALRANNFALVRETEGYRVVPAGEAPGTGSIDSAGGPEPGYGITVVPLQYVSAQTLSKLLDSFGTKAGMVRADSSRNLVVIQGNSADRVAAIDTVLSFDADWMRGQSVGIYPVSNSTPEPIITELDKIIDAGEGGLSQNVVKLQPISRQNAILVVTRKPDLLKTVATWITRLDKAGTAGTGVKVYRMRYGDARQVAALLSDMFVGGSGSGLDSPINQLVPGGGAIASRSDRPSLGGSQQAGGEIGSPQLSAGPSLGAGARLADASGGRTSPATNPTPHLGRDGPLGGAGATGGAPILPGVRIAADVVNNAVLVYANQENYRIIERTIHQLDRPQLQVAIDATIAEVTLNDQLSYGVQFYLGSKNVGLPGDKGSIINTIGSGVLAQTFPGFNFLMGSQATPNLILDALHTVTNVKVLSNPSLVVLDNQAATLQVGDQVPVSTGTATVLTANNTIVNTIDYRSTGIILHVIPRVTSDGNVVLEIGQEISNISPSSTANTLTPTVSQRRVKSSIAIQSGQTVLLAGLISNTENVTQPGIPLLDAIPGVGAMFAHRDKTVGRTELIIFIRPQIIRNGVDARHVAEDLRARMRSMFETSEPPPPAERHSKGEAEPKVAVAAAK